MPSLQSLIETSRSRTPTARVWVGGVQRQLPNRQGAISLGQSFGQPIAGGTIQLVNVPEAQAPQIKDPVHVELGYGGQTLPVFTGWVTNPQRASYPQAWTVQVSDSLWIADFGVQEGMAITIANLITGLPNNVAASEALERLMTEWAGIPPVYTNIPLITVDGTNAWVLGQLTPVAWSGGSPLQAALDICTAAGYWLFCDGAGVVRAVPMSGAPTGQPFRTFTQGEDLLVQGAPTLQADSSTIYTRVVVTGANTGVEGVPVHDTWQTDSPLLPSGKYRDISYSSGLIEFENETDATPAGYLAGALSATGIAKRMLKEHDRQPRVIQGRVKGDPRLHVGMTVALRASRLGLAGAPHFFITGISTTFGAGDYSQTLTLDGGVGPDGYTTVPAPLAAFTYLLHEEWLDGTATIEVFLDGSSSTSLGGGEIVGWTWDAPGGTPDHSAELPGPKWVTFYPAGTPTATITLTARDTDGKIAAMTQTIDLSPTGPQPPTTRELNVAAGNAWYVTPDGGQHWNKVSGEATIAVPPISAAGSALADATAAAAVGLLATGGTSGQHVRMTIDDLATAPTTLATLPGPIAFLWQSETDPTRVWAAVGASIHLSTDGGVTFGAARTPPVPAGDTDRAVRWVVEAAGRPGVVDVLAGAHVYTTFDGGTTWTDDLRGPDPGLAKCYSSGFDRHWVGFIDMPEHALPLRSTEGDTAAFVVTGPATPPASIRALTMLVDEPTMYAVDEQGRIWKGSVDSGEDMAIVATMPTPPGGSGPDTAQHAIRDGDYRVIYITGNEALYKFFPDGPSIATMLRVIHTTEQGHMAGYAGLSGRRLEPEQIEVIIPTVHTGVPGTYGVWHYAPTNPGDHWVLKNSGLPDAVWQGIVASPANADHWAVFTTGNDSPGDAVWSTTDAGATWSPAGITIPAHYPDAPTFSTDGYTILGAAYQQDGTLVVAGNMHFDGINGMSVVWYGHPGAMLCLPVGHSYDAAQTFTEVTDGAGEAVVGGPAARGHGANFLWTLSAAGLIQPTGGDAWDEVTEPAPPGYASLPASIERVVTSGLAARAMVGLNGGHLVSNYDYRAGPLGDTGLTAGNLLTSAISGVYTANIPGAGGIQRIDNPISGPSTTLVAAAGVTFTWLRSDRQRRVGVLARMTGLSDSWVFDGAAWALLPGPAGAAPLIGGGEVIGRGGTP